MSGFEQQFGPVTKLAKMFPDEKRAPLVSEPEDWDAIIIPALVAWTALILRTAEGPTPFNIVMAIPMLRVL